MHQREPDLLIRSGLPQSVTEKGREKRCFGVRQCPQRLWPVRKQRTHRDVGVLNQDAFQCGLEKRGAQCRRVRGLKRPVGNSFEKNRPERGAS